MKKNQPRILIAAPFYSETLDQLKEKYPLDYYPKADKELLKKIIADYTILIVSTNPAITSDILQYAKNLKIIIRLGIGVDHIDLLYCKEKKIKVCNTPTSNIQPVVELVFSQLIRVLRRIDDANANLFAGNFRSGLKLGEETIGKTIGVIGTGRIGSRICKLAKFFCNAGYIN